MLLRQEKKLIRHLDDFKDFGSKLFEDRTAFYNLKKIFQNMLADVVLGKAYLVVDGLDECKNDEPGLRQLLQLISEVSENNDKIKWLVSSRNVSDIETSLKENGTRTRLSLELNTGSVAQAVEAYIDHKMSRLAERYRDDYAREKDPAIHEKVRKVQDDVAKELRQKADGTFLWVALVFKQIEQCGADEVLERVSEIPSGLDKIYDQMMRQIIERKDRDSKRCKSLLVIAVNTYRPLQVLELVRLAGLPELAPHTKIVRLCGLLTIGEDDNIVYFVHQSARDYLAKHAKSYISEMFDVKVHCSIVSRSLEAMNMELRRNIYDLQYPGFSIDEVRSLHPDPLTSIRYCCIYWIDHLCKIPSSLHDEVGLCDDGTVHVFLEKHFLHWLEALSLMKTTSSAVTAIKKLKSLLEVSIHLPLKSCFELT